MGGSKGVTDAPCQWLGAWLGRLVMIASANVESVSNTLAGTAALQSRPSPPAEWQRNECARVRGRANHRNFGLVGATGQPQGHESQYPERLFALQTMPC